MLSHTPEATTKNSFFKSPLAYTALLTVAVALYVAWTFFSRHHEDRAYEQRIRSDQAQKQRTADQTTIEQLGGSELAIQMFYATPEVRRGESAQLCFGVANAKSVTLEPQANPVWPSHNLCVDVKPTESTTYTLTATGSDGKTVSGKVTVAVK